jgi:hypothetical protein
MKLVTEKYDQIEKEKQNIRDYTTLNHKTQIKTIEQAKSVI